MLEDSDGFCGPSLSIFSICRAVMLTPPWGGGDEK